jgi:heme/copper-type cytochrome/quinol oxidase subunit 2
MRSNTARIAIAVGAVAVIVVLFVVLNGGDDNNDKSSGTTATTPTTTTTTGGKTTTIEAKAPVVVVRDGQPVGGIKKLTFTKGDQVRFRINSDVADEIHVHGYDLKKDVPAGGSVTFSFPASIEGVFVVELEGRGTQIAQLSVNPA